MVTRCWLCNIEVPEIWMDTIDTEFEEVRGVLVKAGKGFCKECLASTSLEGAIELGLRLLSETVRYSQSADWSQSPPARITHVLFGYIYVAVAEKPIENIEMAYRLGQPSEEIKVVSSGPSYILLQREETWTE